MKQFIISQGSSRTVVQMEWDKIWSINKKIIDPVAPRYTALEKGATARVLVRGIQEKKTTAALHPKNETVGSKDVWISDQILIDLADVDLLRVGENATFINWGNIKISNISRYISPTFCSLYSIGSILSNYFLLCRVNDEVVIDGEPNIEDRDYKKTPKLTWLAVTNQAKFTPCTCVYFDHIISKPVLAKDEDFKQYINENTRVWTYSLLFSKIPDIEFTCSSLFSLN